MSDSIRVRDIEVSVSDKDIFEMNPDITCAEHIYTLNDLFRELDITVSRSGNKFHVWIQKK